MVMEILIILATLFSAINSDQLNVNEEEDNENVVGIRIPMGYRFFPTDDELIHCLVTKVEDQIQNPWIQDINASEFYSKPPSSLIECCSKSLRLEKEYFMEKERFFFIHVDMEKFDQQEFKERHVGEEGFWKPYGDSRSIFNCKDRRDINIELSALKLTFTYFRQYQKSKDKKTHWIMEEYSLLNPKVPLDSKSKCVVARVRGGRSYDMID